MSCFRCGQPGPEGAFFCPWCGVSLRPLPADVTVVVPPARPAASATLTPPPVDPNATLIGAPSALDPGATIIGLPGTAAPPRLDPDATIIGAPPALDPGATTIGLPAAGASPRARDTRTPRPGPPPGRSTGLTSRPGTSPTDPGATVIAPRGATPTPEAGPADGPPQEAEEQGPLEVGQQFGRYTIIRMLGIGGMGAVYQAWDEELEVAVAIKVIRPEITADPVAGRELEKRFKRELLLARQVTHKNVVRIHDLGEIDGIKYITMSYVHGRELASIVKDEGKLPVQKALKVMRGVVSGLAAANGAGVVHRDLKPANIMVEADTDEPLIMDFGIARSTAVPEKDQQATGAGQAQLAGMAGTPPGKTPSALTQATTVGAIVGTVSYMSPEQVRAEEVDQRADLYALGLIFYDMLLGPKRFEGLNPIEELQKRMVEPPASPRSVDDTVPEALDRIIMRCLAPDRNERYETTADLEAELNKLDDDGVPIPVYRRLTWRTMAAAATLMLSLMGATYWITRPPPPRPAPPPTSVLVTDFVDKTNTPVFKGTLESALVQGMEGAAFITAFSRTAARQIAEEQVKPGTPLDVPTARLISAREGIKVVLAGTVDRDGDGYAVSVEAIDPAVNKVLTSATTTASSRDDVLAAVGRAAAKLRGALGDTTPESARVAAAETVTAASLPALQAYIQAQEHASRREDQKALEQFQRAIDIDPNFGRAYAGMGVLYYNMKEPGKAQGAYDKALKLLDRMSDREKYRTLGAYYLGMALNYEKAVETYEKLVALYPADDVAHANLSLSYLYRGDVQRALAQVREVLKLNPRSTSDRYNLAIQSVYAGDFEGAVKEGTRAIKESPTYEQPYLAVALATLFLDDIAEARATYQRAEQANPSKGGPLGRLGRADLLLYRGQYREALSLLRQSIENDEKGGGSGMLASQYVALAEAHLALGQEAEAVTAALKAAGKSEHESVWFPAATVLVEARRDADAEKIAVQMENTFQSHMMAYAQLVRAAIAARDGRYGQAVDLFRDSIKRRDTWLGRLMLGRLYVETERYTEAIGELDTCLKRYGETGDVFFYDFPTVRYLPPLFYYLARAQEALGAADAKKHFDTFISLREDARPADPLVEDARKRVASLAK